MMFGRRADMNPMHDQDSPPNCDSMATSSRPLLSDSPQEQLLKSQVYLFEREALFPPRFSQRPRHCCPIASVQFITNRLGRPMPALTPVVFGMPTASANLLPVRPLFDEPSKLACNSFGGTSYRKQPTSVPMQPAVVASAAVALSWSSLPGFSSSSSIILPHSPTSDAIPYSDFTPLVDSVPTTSVGCVPLTQSRPIRPPPLEMPNNSVGMTSFRKQQTCHVTSLSRRPVAGMMRMSSSNVVPPPLQIAALPHQQIGPPRLPFAPPSALRPATQPSASFLGAPFASPCTSHASAPRSVGFQGTPQLSAVPGSDFRSDHHCQQQQQVQTNDACGRNQLMMLLLHHRHICAYFMHKVDSLLRLVGDDLSRVVASSDVPSSSVRGVLDLLWLLRREVDAVRWQYRVAYSTAYDVSVTQTDSGHARVNPNVLRENIRVILLCSQNLKTVALKIRRPLLMLPDVSTAEATLMAEAAVRLHINEFRRFVDFFKEALKTFCRLLVPDTSQTAECRQSTSILDADHVQKAFSYDVDQLLLTQQQQRQAAISAPSTCESVDGSTLPVVDGLSDSTRVSCSSVLNAAAWNVNSAQQSDELEATSTSVGTEDISQAEIKFPHALRCRRTDLGCVAIDENGNRVELCPDHDGGLAATNFSEDLDVDETRVVCAVDLMSLGGFDLFMPFTASSHLQEAGTRSAASAAPSSDSGDSGIVVKLEAADDAVPPPDDVISAPVQKTEDTDVSPPAFSPPTATDVADDGRDDKSLICRIESVFSIPSDGLDASLISSSAEQRSSTIGEERADEKATAAASSESHDSVPISISSVASASSKIVDADVRIGHRRLQQRQSRMLTASEINRALRKRTSTRSWSTNDQRRKRVYNTGDRKPASETTRQPAVVSTTELSNQSTWVIQKRLLIAPPPPLATVKRRRGRPPKRRVDTVAMPSPAELKCRPEARRKILAMYRSAQFTPLDGNKRTSTRAANGDEADPLKVAFATSLSVQSRTSSRPLRHEAGSLFAGADKSTQQSVVKSTVVTELNATTQSCASSDRPPSSGDGGTTIESTAMRISSVDVPPQTDLGVVSRQVGENGSILSHTDMNVAAPAADNAATTIAMQSPRSCYSTVVEELKNVDDVDDDEDSDRLVIDMDYTDPNHSASSCSISNDYCNNYDGIQTAMMKSGCCLAVDSTEKHPTSVIDSCSLEADEVDALSSSANNMPLRPSCGMETTSGDAVAVSTSSGCISMSDKCNSRWTVVYSDISDVEDEDRCTTSTEGARLSSLDGVNHQQVAELSTVTAGGGNAVDVAEPRSDKAQTTTVSTPTRHSNSTDVDRKNKYVEMRLSDEARNVDSQAVSKKSAAESWATGARRVDNRSAKSGVNRTRQVSPLHANDRTQRTSLHRPCRLPRLMPRGNATVRGRTSTGRTTDVATHQPSSNHRLSASHRHVDCKTTHKLPDTYSRHNRGVDPKRTAEGSSATDTRREIFTNGTRPVSTCDLNGRVPRAPADRRGWPPDLMSLHHIATSIRGRPLTRRTTQVTGLPSPSNRPPWLSRCRADQRNGQVEPTWRVVKPCSVAISQTSVRMRIERRS